MNNEWEDIELQCPYTLHAQKKKQKNQSKSYLKPTCCACIYDEVRL